MTYCKSMLLKTSIDNTNSYMRSLFLQDEVLMALNDIKTKKYNLPFSCPCLVFLKEVKSIKDR